MKKQKPKKIYKNKKELMLDLFLCCVQSGSHNPKLALRFLQHLVYCNTVLKYSHYGQKLYKSSYLI